jgi:hypothetical protein
MKNIHEIPTNTIVEAMKRFGGSFMNSLSRALETADDKNRIKILDNWKPEITNLLDIHSTFGGNR